LFRFQILLKDLIIAFKYISFKNNHPLLLYQTVKRDESDVIYKEIRIGHYFPFYVCHQTDIYSFNFEYDSEFESSYLAAKFFFMNFDFFFNLRNSVLICHNLL